MKQYWPYTVSVQIDPLRHSDESKHAFPLLTGFTHATTSTVIRAKGKRKARTVIETVCSKRVGRGRHLCSPL